MKKGFIIYILFFLSIFLLSCKQEKQDIRFENTYSYDSINHYFVSTDGTLVKGLEKHSFTSFNVNSEGKYFRTCTICGYKEFRDDSLYILSNNDHCHYYKNSETGEIIFTESHDYEDYEIVEESTVYMKGKKIKKCKICDYIVEEEIEMKEVKKIPKLKRGDKIALIAPASPSSTDQTAINAKKKLESYGFNVVMYPSVTEGKNYSVSYLALSDEARAEEINSAFKDKSINGIICLRGGYGSSRTLDLLDYDAIREYPKFFTGYSDITALINAFYFKCGFISYQGFMGLTLAKSDLDIITKTDVEELLLNNNSARTFKFGTYISKSKESVTGTLIGGNLSLFVHLLGSEYLVDCKDKIVFLEDVGEETYSLDRMFTKLRLFGVFKDAKAIVLGYFTNESEKASIDALIRREFKDLDIPVLYGFKSGHEYPFISLPIGANVKVSESGLEVIDDVFE